MVTFVFYCLYRFFEFGLWIPKQYIFEVPTRLDNSKPLFFLKKWKSGIRSCNKHKLESPGCFKTMSDLSSVENWPASVPQPILGFDDFKLWLKHYTFNCSSLAQLCFWSPGGDFLKTGVKTYLMTSKLTPKCLNFVLVVFCICSLTIWVNSIVTSLFTPACSHLCSGHDTRVHLLCSNGPFNHVEMLAPPAYRYTKILGP
jgi:hypothetical protein